MSSRLNRFSTGAALLSVAALALAACSGGANASQAASSAPPLDKVTIMAPFLSTEPPAPDNELGTQLDTLVGTHLEINWVPNSSYPDKTNITLAGSDVPQVMVIQGKDASFVKNAKAGAFWDLGKYLKDYPGLQSKTPAVEKAASLNGTIYGIYRPRDAMRTAVIIRKDWLDKLGLQMPKTTDDLYNIAKAFTEDDPDGNGQNDTYGLIVPKWPGSVGSNSPWDAIEAWFGAGNVWTQQGGKLAQSFTTPQWKSALDFERKIVSNGYINPDYATLDSVDWNTPFVNGKGGIIIDTWSRVYQINGLFEKANPSDYQKYVAATGNLVGPDGKMHALPTAGYSGFIAIPKSSVKTEAQLRQVLAVLEKLTTKDAQVLINNGIEGKNFTVVDGGAKPVTPATDESTLLTDTAKTYSQLGIAVSGNLFYPAKQPNDYDQKLWDDAQKIIASDLKNAVFNPAAAYVSDAYVLNGATLDNTISDARIKYDAGQIDAAGLDAALKQWKSMGGDQVTAQINQLYAADKK